MPEGDQLPLDTQPTQPGLRPLSVSQNGEAIEPRAEVVTPDDPVEKYLAENPETPPTSEPVAEAPAPPAEETPAAPVVAAEPSGEAKPAVEAVETKPAVEPTEEKPVVAAEPKPAEQPAQRPTYAPEEKIALGASADGSPIEWTRGQIVSRLKQYAELEPKAKEADAFKSVFGMDATAAEQQWKPVLMRLAADEPMAALVESVYGSEDPGRVDYLSACAQHYDKEVASGAIAPKSTQPAQPAEAKVPAAVQRELDEGRQFRERYELQEATNRMNGEIAEATRKYPFLAADLGLMNELLLTAQYLYAQDEKANVPPERRRGIPDAVAAKASIYDALLTARQPAPAPAASEQATVLGTPGPGPAGSQKPADNRPRKFNDLEDAVDEHLRSYKGQ